MLNWLKRRTKPDQTSPRPDATRPHDRPSEVHVSEELKNAERMPRLGTEEDKPYSDRLGE